MEEGDRLLVVSLLIALLAGGCISQQAEPSPNETEKNITSTNSTLLGPKGKPIYYYFFSTGCPACDLMAEGTLQNGTVLAVLQANFTYEKVNTAQNRKLANKYGIYGIPANVFTYPDGSEIGRILGFVPAEDFLQVLDQVLQFYVENP